MEDYSYSQADAGFSDLDLGSQLAVIRFEGSEALAFLQRQLSNDVTAIHPGMAQLNAYLTPKGRVIALLTLMLHENAVLALVDRQMADLTASTLQRYVIRADVQILAPDPAWSIQGRLDTDASKVDVQLKQLEVIRQGESLIVQWPGNRQIVLTPLSLRTAATSEPQHSAAMQAWQQLDIEYHLARIGPQESEHYVAQMLSLDTFQVVNFKKGCYPGQEVVARTHYRGRIKRHLVSYHSDLALKAGTTLSLQDADTLKPVGKTLQGVMTTQSKWMGLAVVHESGIAAKKLLAAGDPLIEVCLVPHQS